MQNIRSLGAERTVSPSCPSVRVSRSLFEAEGSSQRGPDCYIRAALDAGRYARAVSRNDPNIYVLIDSEKNVTAMYVPKQFSSKVVSAKYIGAIVGKDLVRQINADTGLNIQIEKKMPKDNSSSRNPSTITEKPIVESSGRSTPINQAGKEDVAQLAEPIRESADSRTEPRTPTDVVQSAEPIRKSADSRTEPRTPTDVAQSAEPIGKSADSRTEPRTPTDGVSPQDHLLSEKTEYGTTAEVSSTEKKCWDYCAVM